MVRFAVNILFVLIVSIMSFQSSRAQIMTEEKKKSLRQELKSYLRDPESYQALMADIQTRLTTSEQQIKSLKSELKRATRRQNELEQKNAFCDSVIMSLQQENTILKGGDLTSPSAAGKKKITAASTPKQSSPPPTDGVAYKIQIGAYKRMNTPPLIEERHCLGIEENKGVNRYVIGQFRDEKSALRVVSDIRRMGIRDAFITKYVNGKRVVF